MLFVLRSVFVLTLERADFARGRRGLATRPDFVRWRHCEFRRDPLSFGAEFIAGWSVRSVSFCCDESICVVQGMGDVVDEVGVERVVDSLDTLPRWEAGSDGIEAGVSTQGRGLFNT